MTPRKPIAERLLVWLSNLGVTLVCISVMWFMFTVIRPYEVLSRMDVSVESAIQGGNIVIALDYCKDVAIVPKRVIMTLQNSITIVLPTENIRIPTGCRVSRVVEHLSPEIPPGVYTIELMFYYEPWPWRTIPYSFRSKQFVIQESSHD